MSDKGRAAFKNFIRNVQLPEEILHELADTEIERVILDKKKSAISIVFKYNQIHPTQILDELHEKLKVTLKEYKQVTIINRFLNSGTEEILREYWLKVISSLKTKGATFNLLKSAKWELEGENLKIFLGSESIREHLLDNNIVQLLQTSLFFWVENKLNIILELSEEKDIKAYNKLLKTELELDIKELLTETTEILADNDSKYNKKIKKNVYGKKITEEPQKISELSGETNNVVITGKVFSLDLIDLRNEASMLIIGVTDYQDSIEAKLFNRAKTINKQIYEMLSQDVWLTIRGNLRYDTYSNELVLMISDIQHFEVALPTDSAKEKRVELHLHTNMSVMDGVSSAYKYIERAAQLGHSAIAFTDHGVVQAYPDAYEYGKQLGVKIIFGLEANMITGEDLIVVNPKDQLIKDDTYVVFDLETTGISANLNKIIEIGAVKVSGNVIVDEFSAFVNPGEKISNFISELTGISNADLENAPDIVEVLGEFRNFIGKSTLVAYNSKFDVSFLASALTSNNMTPLENTVIDSLALARLLEPKLKNHRLETLCKRYNIDNQDQHRAISDARATAALFLIQIEDLFSRGITNINNLNPDLDEIDYEKVWPKHLTILVKNQNGLKNMYKIVSKSHLDYFYRQPKITKTYLNEHREGLLFGSGCAKGALVDAILNKTDSEIEELAMYFDYLEVQPISNYQYLLSNNLVNDQAEIVKIIKKIIALGEKLAIPVVAVGNVHHLDQEEAINRKIIINSQLSGARYHNAKELYPAHYLTTAEMLNQFDFIDKKTAEKIVVTNPRKINEQIEDLQPFPAKLHTPTIAGAADDITKLSYDNARKIYGDPLPEIVSDRLERELDSIIENGFSVIYLISHRLVAKSLADGYLVGSRGSVGSSFVATMTEITEVNPLPPHYICDNCHYSHFISDQSVGSGYDLPDKNCPKCNEKMIKEGHNIPFETFMGFEGDKVPDIDLNFSGEYQARIHRETEETFGEKKVFRAGTISTIADKTAFGYVRKYVNEHNLELSEAEISRLAKGCEGVKRTTGQHPGGQIVIPQDMDYTEFTPIQRPADDQKSEVITTHFDYHALSGTLLKLDLLGHDDPTALKMLHEQTGVDPRLIKFDDPRLYELFTSTEPLQLTKPLKNYKNGAIGVPEFGTKFVRQMLDETKPTTFAELVRISGLSHGTDVWRNNAQDLIKRGDANLSQVICTRDDIMLYLTAQGLDSAVAFAISEKVRKGKGLTQVDINEMRKHSVPAWYIESCQKIKYMFPKAHAVAYVQMAMRIVYYKIYYPIHYYSTYFTLRSNDFDIGEISNGLNGIKERINEIIKKGNDSTAKERDLLIALEVVQEMYHRGFKIENIDLYRSHSHQYVVNESGDGLIPPFISIGGVGLGLANNIVKGREQADFISVEDLQKRCRVSDSIIESLEKLDVLKGLNSTDQISLF